MENSDQHIDHLFRHQYGKMVAVLTRLFSFSDLEKAEDIVQDTFAKALANWRINGLPDRPEAWLMQVAKNRGIDYFRSQKRKQSQEIKDHFLGTTAIAIDKLFLDKEVSDAQLRMIFTLCHPELNAVDQIAITLQIVSGFSIKEIAAALLKPVEQMKKRVQRAKAKLKSKSNQLIIPQGELLVQRRNIVLKVIYLIFNEGYSSSNGDELIKRNLCAEAMRLGKIICDHPVTNHPDASALVGLMCFLAARFESRIDEEGHIILFENQDRKQWNKDLIYQGNKYMFKAVETKVFSKYHYEAAIQSEYMKAEGIQQTDWSQIMKWYEHLSKLDPSPIIELNKAIVNIYRGRFEDAQQMLEAIDVNTLGSRKYLLYSAFARLYIELKDWNQATNYLLQAHNAANTSAEKALIQKRIQLINKTV